MSVETDRPIASETAEVSSAFTPSIERLVREEAVNASKIRAEWVPIPVKE
jgi:hypothetical protein